MKNRIKALTPVIKQPLSIIKKPNEQGEPVILHI